MGAALTAETTSFGVGWPPDCAASGPHRWNRPPAAAAGCASEGDAGFSLRVLVWRNFGSRVRNEPVVLLNVDSPRLVDVDGPPLALAPKTGVSTDDDEPRSGDTLNRPTMDKPSRSCVSVCCCCCCCCCCCWASLPRLCVRRRWTPSLPKNRMES